MMASSFLRSAGRALRPLHGARAGLAAWLVAVPAWLPSLAHAQELVVGQTLSLTGPSAKIAADLQRGRQACVDHVNAQGGVRGHMLKLVTRDDEGNPKRAVLLAQELAREGAAVMLGAMGPAVNMPLLEWAGTTGMPVVGPYGGDIGERVQDRGTAFFLTANQSAEAERLAAHLSSLGLKRVVIVRGSDESGQAALVALEEALGLANAGPREVIPVRADGADAATAAAAVGQAQPQVVLLATSGRATVAMLRALSASGGGGGRLLQTYGMSSSASQSELLQVGQQAQGFSMSQVVPFPRDTRLPVVVTFQAALRGAPGDRNYVELEGCLAPLMLAEVLRRKPFDATPAGVLKALKSAGRVNVGGFEVDLADRTRPGSRFTDMVYVGANGRISR